MQTELFEMSTPVPSPEVEASPKTSVLEKTFLTLRLDQFIGVLLVLMVFYVLSFTFGYEKGRHSNQNTQVIKAAPVQAAPALPANLTVVEDAPSLAAKLESEPAATVPAKTAAVQTGAKSADLGKSKPAGKYTIQHVIYKTKSAAEREIQNLSKKGQSAFIIPSGKYLQVCISGFQTKKEADKYMKQLRSQRVISGDAYIRPIPA